MIEVNINWQTFGLSSDQLDRLNSLLSEAKLRTKVHGGFEFEDNHGKAIVAVTTTRWTGEE